MSSEEDGLRIARILIGERLAACVSMVPGLISVYRWEGKIREEREVLLLIKTSGESVDALIQRLSEVHPYSLPEIIAFRSDCVLEEYEKWVSSEVHGTPGGD